MSFSNERSQNRADDAERTVFDHVGIPQDVFVSGTRSLIDEFKRWSRDAPSMARGTASWGRLYESVARGSRQTSWRTLEPTAYGFESSEQNITLILTPGSQCTGIGNEATNRNPRSQRWIDSINCDEWRHRRDHPLFATLPSGTWMPGTHLYAFFLYHIDIKSGELRSEFSLARNISDKGFVDAWWRQSPLDAISLEGDISFSEADMDYADGKDEPEVQVGRG